MFKIYKLHEVDFRKPKYGIHGVQGGLVVLAWILTVAVIAKPGSVGSAIYWYFFLTWITLPALLYLAVIPLWQRTSKFSNAYANVIIDFVWTIFWLAAVAAVQVWTSSGITDNSTGYCASFSFGDQDKCVISFGLVVIGVVILLLWVVALAISSYSLFYYRKNGYLPNSRPSISKPASIEPKLSNATSIAPEGLTRTISDAQRKADLEKGVVHTQTEDGTHPGRILSWGQSPPLTAPSRFDGPARPRFRTISYGSKITDEANSLAASRPHGKFGVPPRLELTRPSLAVPKSAFGHGSRTATSAAGPDQNRMPPVLEMPSAPLAVSSGHTSSAKAPQKPILRVPVPGPASYHNGGYNSAYHTPLPTGMVPTKNSWWGDLERERG